MRIRFSIKADYDAKAQGDSSELFLDQSYIDWGNAEGWRLKFGRQLVVIGESEYFQLLDIVNPLDQREPGLVELDELRLPILASRLSYVGKRWGLDVVFPQEFRSIRYPEARADFDAFIGLGGRQNININKKPDVEFFSPSWMMRTFISRPWGDVSVVTGRTYQYASSLQGYHGEQYTADYPEIETLGLSSNYVYSNWLIKGEYAYQRGGVFLRNNIQQQLEAGNASPTVVEEHLLHQLMFGVRYGGFRNTIINIELLNKVIDNHNELLVDQQRISGSMVSANYIIWSDKLSLEWQWLRWWQQKGSVSSLRLDYVWRNEWLFYVSYIDYLSHSSAGIYEPFKENDRFLMGINYSY